jgi:hypothetical protein
MNRINRESVLRLMALLFRHALRTFSFRLKDKAVQSALT